MRRYDIDIALIQETFLIEEDKLYIEGYKVYRADNQLRRKGVAILINSKLDLDCIKLAQDPNGRFLKVRIKNRDNLFSKTVSSIYLEPNGNIEEINETGLEADIIGGDMNDANTTYNKNGVFHTKNIDISDKIDLKKRELFDHSLLIGTIKFCTKKVKEKENMEVLDMAKVNKNQEQIINKLTGKEMKIILQMSLKKIQIQGIEERLNINEYGLDYIKLKEEVKINNKQELINRYSNINTILTLGILNKENWAKINGTILQKKHNKIWRETSNKNKITEDFKTLYKHTDVDKTWNIDDTANIIKNTISIIQANLSMFKKEDKLYTPYSKAKDYMGFSQRALINAIKDKDINQEIIKFGEIIGNIDKGIEIFLNNYVRTILIKKKPDAVEQKNLRIISIIPAWLMILEKLSKPLIQLIINEKINENQFGFRPKSDCGLAKAMIYYKANSINIIKLYL